jgi:TrmH family RNA methyltransferase
MTDQERYHAARRDPGRAVLEGLHALKHALRFGAVPDDVVTDDRPALDRLAENLAPDLAARLHDLRIRVVTARAFDALSPSPVPTRVIALAPRPVHRAADILGDATAARPVVVLDQPRHAGNIGAAVRVAAAADAGGLITIGPVDPWGPAAVRGGAGLQFALPVARIERASGVPCDAMRALLETKRRVVAVDPDGVAYDSGTAAGGILVFGSERDGISAELLERADARVRIPMRDGVSSLNLATAVAIMLYR